MLCASFVVQSSTGTSYTLHSALHTLHFTQSTLPTSHFTFTLLTFHSTLHTLHLPLHTPHSTLSTPHSTLSTPHCRLVTGEICTVFKRCFLCVSLCISCLLWTVDQVPSLRRYARTMYEKTVCFPIAEVSTRSPRTWIHSGSWLPSCFIRKSWYTYIVENVLGVANFQRDSET